MTDRNEHETVGVRKITAVEKAKNAHRYRIFLDDEYVFTVHEDLLVKYRLLKGEWLRNDRMEEIVIEEEKHAVYASAARMLSRRPMSAGEVRTKLKRKGYEQVHIDEAIGKLTDQGWIDDEQFAKLWAEQRILGQKKGRLWVRQELAQKGISKEEIAGAIAGIDEEREFAAAYDLASKKWSRTDAENGERARKLAGFLLRRGYANGIVMRVLRELRAGELEDSETEL